MTPEQLEHLDHLLGAWRNQTLDDAQARELADWIEHDAEARRHYIRYTAMCASLRRYLVGESPAAATDLPGASKDDLAAIADAAAVAAPAAAPSRDASAKPGVLARLGFWIARPVPASMLAAAALIALVFGVTFVVLQLHHPPKAPLPPAFVARISSDLNAVWRHAGERRPWQVGDWLPTGPVRLESGFAEITFDSGATVVLEGPAEFDLQSVELGHLRLGKLVADVPEQAVGFTVTSPSMRVVDLGTAFAMDVAEDGAAEVHVLEGLVEAGSAQAAAGETSRVRLSRLEARRFVRDPAAEARAVEHDAGRFRRRLPRPKPKPYRYSHWSFDEGSGRMSRDLGRGFEGAPHDGRLVQRGGGDRGPTWSKGRYGGAIYLDGVDDFVQTDFRGIGGHAPRTVAMWVRVPRGASTNEALSLMCWGSFTRPGGAWQISWNRFEEDGPIGPLRIGVLEGEAVGVTDLRDGRWHHLAVVFVGGPGADVATHTRLYLDGRLQADAADHPRPVNTDVSSASSRRVRMGYNLANHGHFRGWLDEVYIFDAALSPQQIVELMNRNRVP